MLFWFEHLQCPVLDGRLQPRLLGEVGAPLHLQPIPLRSIGCQCGEPLPRSGLLQMNLYTTNYRRCHFLFLS
jgi:hypothetical protein